MSRFVKLASGVDTSAILLDLMRAPYLWDQNSTRRTYPGTPHAAMQDIWCRFRLEAELTGLDAHKTEYRCVNWPAWHALPSLRPLVRAIKQQVDAVELGSVLVVRLPAGALIEEHDDRGSWAAEWFNTKVHVVLDGGAVYRCADHSRAFERGDVFTFDNLLPHAVHANDDMDRIACIISCRCEP